MRTPQQASIDSSAARETWERGEEIEYNCEGRGWLTLDCNNSLHPWFTSGAYTWRPKSKPPETAKSTIVPGFWRRRDGVVEEIVSFHCGCAWRNKANTLTWYQAGNHSPGYANPHPKDLLTQVFPVWRAWKPAEVPLGREIRLKSDPEYRQLITHNEKPAEYFNDYELLNPDGSYSPCGVPECKEKENEG